MRRLSADIVFPGNTPAIPKGVVVCEDDGTILSVGERDNFNPDDLEIFEGILCPGFINAHCHLELSYMLGRVPEKKGLVQFIMDLLRIRNEKLEVVLAEIERADREMSKNGIVAVGDISNDDHSLATKADSDIYYHTFVEAYGFVPEDAQKYFDMATTVFNKARALNLSSSITPHAPYSVPPELFKLIYAFGENHPAIFSIHNQETADETQFFKDGTGGFQHLMESFFKIDSHLFHPTGKRSLESILPYLPTDKKMLLVHNTMTTAADIKQAKEHNPYFYWCTCPNANIYIENQLPDYTLFLKESNNVCVGTDSLASNHQLSVLEEIKTIQQHFPALKTETLIQWATINGAKFLGVDNKLGSLEAGKKPGVNLISNTSGGNLGTSSIVKRLI